MKLNRIAAATAAAATAAAVIVSGCGVAHHGAASLAQPAISSQHAISSRPVQVKAHTDAVRRPGLRDHPAGLRRLVRRHARLDDHRLVAPAAGYETAPGPRAGTRRRFGVWLGQAAAASRVTVRR